MPKLFPIGIEVEEIAVGSVLRILNKTPGVAKLHLNLLGEEEGDGGTEIIRSNEQPTPTEVRGIIPLPRRKVKDGSMAMVIAKALAITASPNAILRELLAKNGYSKQSLPSQMTKMVQDGHVKSVAPGVWRLTTKGSRHFKLEDIQETITRTYQGNKEVKNGYGVRKLVLTSLENATQLLASDLRKILEENNYSPKNMTGTVGKMKGEGLIKSSDGVYSITENGRAELNRTSSINMETTIES